MDWGQISSHPLNAYDGLYIRYGNWCGPGNTAEPPIDNLDAACKKHDKCYESAGLSWADILYYADKNEACLDDKLDLKRNCDKEFCNDIRSIKPTNWKQTTTIYIANKLFCD